MRARRPTRKLKSEKKRILKLTTIDPVIARADGPWKTIFVPSAEDHALPAKSVSLIVVDHTIFGYSEGEVEDEKGDLAIYADIGVYASYSKGLLPNRFLHESIISLQLYRRAPSI